MAWRHLVISQPAKLSYKNKQLLIQINSGLQQVPLIDVHTIVIMTTRAVVTTYLVQKIIEYNIKLIFCNELRNPCAELNGYYQNVNRNNNIKKQISWSQKSKDKLWHEIVQAKISSQAMHVHSLGIDETPILKELNAMEFADESNREAVVAKKYFSSIFGPEFVRREDDAINAGLNYGYAILLSCFNREITAQGYLTQLGIHHESIKNDFNLSSDLMEPFRTIVDLIVKRHAGEEFTDYFKYDLVDVLNFELEYDGKKMYLENVIHEYVKESINYLNGAEEIPQFLVQRDAG